MNIIYLIFFQIKVSNDKSKAHFEVHKLCDEIMGYEKSVWQVAQISALPPAYLSAKNVTDLLLHFPTPLSDQLSNYFQQKIFEVLILSQE